MSDQAQQLLYSSLAHVFRIDPDTKKKWLPISKQAVQVSYYYHNNKYMYGIICIENAKTVVNSTITSAMSFTKTSQKFGQWSDAKANTIYGLGFANESDLDKFAEKFTEMKHSIKQGTPPAIPKFSLQNVSSTSTSLNGSLTGGSLKSMSSNSTGSIEDDQHSPGSHRSSSSLTDSQLKYENDRLKKALAQSSANAKKWENEFQTLKNNNARLTAALQESAVNVEKWKEQLNNYKEENARLRKKLAAVSSKSTPDNTSISSELQNQLREAKAKIKQQEEEFREKSQHRTDELRLLEAKNAELTTKLQQHVESNANAPHGGEITTKQKSSSHKLDQLANVRIDLEEKIKELDALQLQMASILKS